MSTSYIVVNIADGQIEGVELSLPRGHWDGCVVAAKNDWN